MLLGHIAVASIANQTVFQQRSFVFLVVCSFIPDIIDKPAQLLFGLPGRGIGHSLVVFLCGALLLLIVSRGFKLPRGLILAGICMWFAHLAGDFLEWHVLLWPFYKVPIEPYPRFDLAEKLYQFYIARMWPEQFWLEMICITVALLLLVLKSQYVRSTSSGK
jgi:membrane-bound metal-dependent hydrolase YbcI (DUF457 family)